MNRVKAYPSNGTRSAADQVAAGAVVPRKFTKAWFRANGAKGGIARGQKLTAKELTAIAQLGVEARRLKRLQKGGNKMTEGSKEVGVDTHDLLFDAMHAFVKLTLLFHSASPWDERKHDEWLSLQIVVLKLPSAHRPYRRYATSEATTKVLCDLGRIILG